MPCREAPKGLGTLLGCKQEAPLLPSPVGWQLLSSPSIYPSSSIGACLSLALQQQQSLTQVVERGSRLLCNRLQGDGETEAPDREMLRWGYGQPTAARLPSSWQSQEGCVRAAGLFGKGTLTHLQRNLLSWVPLLLPCPPHSPRAHPGGNCSPPDPPKAPFQRQPQLQAAWRGKKKAKAGRRSGSGQAHRRGLLGTPLLQAEPPRHSLPTTMRGSHRQREACSPPNRRAARQVLRHEVPAIGLPPPSPL